MQNLQDIWNSLEEIKKEQREIRAVYRDVLNSTGEYEALLDDLENLKVRKKQMELAAAGQMEDKMHRLDFLRHEAAEKRQMLADLSLTQLLRGEAVSISGPGDASYEPLWSVRFKKRD